MRLSLLLSILLPLLSTGLYNKALNVNVVIPTSTNPSATIGTPACINPQRALQLNLERINYLDCLPLLNRLLLEADVNRQNRYNASTSRPELTIGTCSISLLTVVADASDLFWGYRIAMAAAAATKDCIEDSVDQYGGIVWTTSRHLFYAEVKSLGLGGPTGKSNSTATPVSSGVFPDLAFPANSTDPAFLLPNPTTATAVCQIQQLTNENLGRVNPLDCYHLFYNILTNLEIERPLKLRGLYPVKYEQYRTCTMRLWGHSAISMDAIKYVDLLLGAVNVVQTCVVESGLDLGGSVSVGSRGVYFISIHNHVLGHAG